jgi:hypothetical protein
VRYRLTDCTLRVVDTADKPASGRSEPGSQPENDLERDSGAEPSRKDDWLLAFAVELAELSPSQAVSPVPPAVSPAGLSRAETGTILHLARDVAHGVERRFAPLAAYLTGRFVTGRVQQGATVEAALAEAEAAVRRLLRPPAGP